MLHDRLLFPFFALIIASCMNPVHDEAVIALGDEAPGVRKGPLHRPGQPCLTCHGGDGPGPDFETAGTVYERRGETAPAANVVVNLEDSTGQKHTVTTNTAGNFYVETRRFTPTYPLYVTLTRGDTKQEMTTRIGRRGGCADCHRAGGSQALVPAVYLEEAR